MKHILLTISLIFGATTVSMAAEYYCEATSKWDGDDLLYSQDRLKKYKFAVKIKNTSATQYKCYASLRISVILHVKITRRYGPP